MIHKHDIETASQLFSCGMVWDGNLCSKRSRDHLVAKGYAVRHSGMQAMTGRGSLAFLLTPRVWLFVLKRLYRWRRNVLVADAARIKRAMT